MSTPPQEFINVAHEGEIVLNNVRIPVIGAIGYDLVNNFGRKMQQGDPGTDDHPLNSVTTQANWSGGIGTKKYRGDDSRGNSWWSTLWDETENQLTLPPYTAAYLAGNYFLEGVHDDDPVWPHDKLNGVLHITYGQDMLRWDEDPILGQPELFGSNTSPAMPTGKGVTWGNSTVPHKIYIPCGTTYVTHNGTDFAAGEGGEEAISFVVWQEKLFKVDNDGIIKHLDPTTGVGWIGETDAFDGQLTTGSTAQRLFLHYDNDNRTAVHLATTGGVYILDYDNSLLWETPLIYPDHPYSGLAASLWRADAYVSVGAGVHRDAKGLVTAVGLDGRDGLPKEYATGYFVDFAPGYNGLFGLYRSFDPTFVASQETTDMGISPPEGMYTQEPNSFAVLFKYNTLGWHPQWVGSRTPTGVTLASHSGTYRLFWGTRGILYSKILPTGYYNPLYNQNQSYLESRGFHITPYFNFGIDDNPKIIKQIEIKTARCNAFPPDPEDPTAPPQIQNGFEIFYQIDDDELNSPGGLTDGWRPLAQIMTNGEHHIDMGVVESGVFAGHHLGMECERIRLLIWGYSRDDEFADLYDSPAIEWYTIVGRKWMRANRVFSFAADLQQPYDDRSPRALFDVIFNASRQKGGSTLVIGGESFDVDVTASSGNIDADLKFSSIINVDCAEITEVDR